MNKSACFTGHRSISADRTALSDRLYTLLEKLTNERNVTDYYAGGAYGFDAVASSAVIKLREKYPQIKLHLILPCSNAEQTNGWSEEQIAEFQHILAHADSIEYVSEHKTKTCMKQRNTRLVELADFCICYWNVNDRRSGTGQTVRMAQKKGIEIINLFS